MTQHKCCLLVVDDEPSILAALSALLADEFDVLTASCAEAARALFDQRPIDLILTDQNMPCAPGVELLEWVRQLHPRTVRLLMTAFGELDDAVAAINRGQVFRYIFKPWRADELRVILRDAARTFKLERSHDSLVEQLHRLNQELEQRVAQRTRELEEANQELEQKSKMLEKLALTDPLTGLANRRAMDRLAERELRRRDRYPSPLALGVIDVDHFKEINARYLLPGGDQVLIDLARTLNTSLRDIDLIGRIGGEEFLVIAPETNREGAVVLGERIRSTVETTRFVHKEHVIPVRVSLGFAVIEVDQAADYEAMKHIAAAALSEAKSTGRNKCVFYSVAVRPVAQPS